MNHRPHKYKGGVWVPVEVLREVLRQYDALNDAKETDRILANGYALCEVANKQASVLNVLCGEEME